MVDDHRQRPLGSEFTPASTAAEVVEGVDLSGKNVVITGGHGGIGLEVTRALSAAGASVVVAARSPVTAAAAVDGLRRVEVEQLDLMDPSSIDGFVARRLATGRPLHILVNAAGVAPPAAIVRDPRGYEAQFATNHLGHFQLTVGLHPALTAAHGARVVTVTSGAHRFSDIRWDDVNFGTGYTPEAAYAQSKTANVLFTVELDHRWRGDGIRSYAAHPGVVVGTKLNGAAGPDALRAQGLIDDAGRPIIIPEHGRKTPQQGAATIVFGAVSPLLADIGGVYLKDSDVSRLDGEAKPMTTDPAEDIPADVAPHAIDARSARRLWELSERMLARCA